MTNLPQQIPFDTTVGAVILAILYGAPDENVKKFLVQLPLDTLQNIAYAAPILARLCREVFDELPPESEPTNEA